MRELIMSGECQICFEHCLDCTCKNDHDTKMNQDKNDTNMIQINEKDLLELIYWARRYCDGRSTYVPSTFNQIYHKIIKMDPEIAQKDPFDKTLTNEGYWWPYAQDGMYDENTGHFDATIGIKKDKSHEMGK